MTPVDLTDLQGQDNLVYLACTIIYYKLLSFATSMFRFGIFHLSSTLCCSDQPFSVVVVRDQMILIRGSLGLPEGGIVVYHQATFLHQASGHQV